MTNDDVRAIFGGTESEIELVFDPIHVHQYPNSRLIVSGHPLIDVIRNHLARDNDADPHLVEAHVHAQLLGPMGEVSPPQLSFVPRPIDFRHSVTYIPTAVLTYDVAYESDERIENTVRLCFDWTTRKMLPDIPGILQAVMLIDGRPPNAGRHGYGIERLLDAGRKEIERLVLADSAAYAYDIEVLLDRERALLLEHYRTEVQRAPTDEARLTEILEKDVADLERKLRVRTSIRLRSIMRLWWPRIDYVARFFSSRGPFEVGGITFDNQSERLSSGLCQICNDGYVFGPCMAGNHLACTSNCGVRLVPCAECGDQFCPEHGRECPGCSRPLCHHDSKECTSPHHVGTGELFCIACLTEGFDGRLLCSTCAISCSECHRTFPAELTATCRICGERVCIVHNSTPDGFQCDQCGQVTCRHHGNRVSSGGWACSDHSAISTCCGNRFILSQLMPCAVDLHEKLCPDSGHAVQCVSCSQHVCASHRHQIFDRQGEFVCDNCKMTCPDCPEDRSYFARQMSSCAKCGKSTCSEHTHRCVVGGEHVCSEHVRYTPSSEALCSDHVGICIQCGRTEWTPIHRPDQLATCVICTSGVCVNHASRCQTCDSIICQRHHGTMPTCAGCGRSSCGAGTCTHSAQECANCDVAYCRHCVGATGVCATCNHLQPTPIDDRWFNFLASTRGAVGKDIAPIIQSMVESRDQLSLVVGGNQTFLIMVAQYSPSRLQFWKSPQQVRLVVFRDGQIHSAKIEKVDPRWV